MGDRFTVTVGAGSLRSTAGRAVQFPHRWTPEGITYSVQVDTPASAEDLAGFLDVVDAVAEIPRAIRAGAPVRRNT